MLLITAETYSKYIAPEDRSLRTIFGDGAAATLVEAADTPSVSAFAFGTDGSAADTLMVPAGGARPVGQGLKPRTCWRWPSRLYMDGPGILNLTVDIIPRLVEQVLGAAQLSADDVELFLMHQATQKLLEQLRLHLKLDAARLPIALECVGNTVSSTLPMLISDLRVRPAARGHAIVARRIWRGLFLGRLPVDRDLGK